MIERVERGWASIGSNERVDEAWVAMVGEGGGQGKESEVRNVDALNVNSSAHA